MGRREVVNQRKVVGPIALGDLRWLVEQCEGYADDSRVEVQAARHIDVRDDEPATITVHGKLAGEQRR